MNKYDNYVGFDYIPVPYAEYAKAGDMQQGKYDQSMSQLQDLQDRLAALPSRQIDVPGKNKILDDFNQKGSQLIESNKTYNPNLQQQIRNLAREAARDKRIQGITYAYGREKEIKDLEKQMIARGDSPYKYHDDWSKKAYVDASGNEVWDNMYDTDHGVETKYDYYKAAENFTKDFAPKLQSLGMSIQDNNIIYTDKKTGQQTKLPMSFLKTGSVESLNANQKWVKDEVNKLIQPFMSTKEGKQFSHYQGSRYDMNENDIQNRYNNFKAQGLSDNEIKDIFRKDAANQLLLSTIKPVYREQVKYDDITAALNSATGRGSGLGSNIDAALQSPFLSSLYNPGNLGQQPSEGIEIDTPISGQNTQYKDLSDSEKWDLDMVSQEQYKEYKNSLSTMLKGFGSKNPNKNAGKPMSYNEWLSKEKGATKENPYGNLVNDYLKTSREDSGKSRTTLKEFIPEASFKAYADDRISSLNNGNTFIIGGKNNLEKVDKLLGKDELQNYPIEYAGRNAIIPTKHGGQQKVALYTAYLPEDYYEAQGKDVDDIKGSKKEYVDNDGNKQIGYPVTIAIPARNLASWQAAREYDIKQYGPDKEIASEQDYYNATNYNYNIDYLQEYGYQLNPRKTDKGDVVYDVYDKSGNKKKAEFTASELAIPGLAEQVINKLKQ